MRRGGPNHRRDGLECSYYLDASAAAGRRESSFECIGLADSREQIRKIHKSSASLNKQNDQLQREVKALEAELGVDEEGDSAAKVANDLDGVTVVDHWRYFASGVRAQEGGISEIDHDTVAYHYHEPLGVVGQIIPWNFPILMATWKLAPALAAGNCVVLKPAEQTPLGILAVMELIADILPPGVINVVNGFGIEAGKPLAQNKRIAKIAFTGETATGRMIMQYASDNIIPVTLELGGKSPNIFFADVMDADDEFFDKALEGFTMFANDTLYGLGAGVWTRNGNRAYRFGREIQAGRVWTNCYHAYPAHAAFGGYKQSGIGRENHKMMLDHYQNTKNVLVSYSTKALGFF
jgi:acyl-CoA reductase-like NAD-dependent aldehyde dehydrogenase